MITQHIELEDFGQDFHSFDLTDEGEIANSNLQGWIWNGRQLQQFPLKRGDQVVFEDGYTLRYRVTRAKKAKVQAVAA